MRFSSAILAGFDAVSIPDGDNVNVQVFYTDDSWSLRHTYYTPSNNTWNISDPNVVAQELMQGSPVSAFVFNSTNSSSLNVGLVTFSPFNRPWEC
jgi:hypothetical protein